MAAQREINKGVPLAERSATLRGIGRAGNLKHLNRGDRAFILAKINNELGNPRRAECAARIALDCEAGSSNFYDAAERAMALGLPLKAKEFARKAVGYYAHYQEYHTAVSIALKFSVEESALEAAAALAEKLIISGETGPAEDVIATFGLGPTQEEFAKSRIGTLMGEGEYRWALRLALKFSFKEEAKEAALKDIGAGRSLPLENQLKIARESGAAEPEIHSAIEKALEDALTEGDSPKGILFSMKDSTLPQEKNHRIIMLCIRKIAESGNPVAALVAARENGIPREEARDIALNAISFCMGTEADETLQIARDFGIGEEELSRIAEEVFLRKIREGNHPRAANIAAAYRVSEASRNFLAGFLNALPK